MNPRWPYMNWFVTDWLGDPKVARCEPATRGIYFDWLCNMHSLDRCGVITGTREELARLGRCCLRSCDAAITDLERTNAADVTLRNGIVTVINRRMRREFLARKQGTNRVKAFRDRQSVTPRKPDILVPVPYPEDTKTAPDGAGALRERLNVMFKREAADAWSYAEETALVEIHRRPAWLAELEHMHTYRRSLAQDQRKFYPQTIYAMLTKWTETLDKARVQCPVKKVKQPESKPVERKESNPAMLRESISYMEIHNPNSPLIETLRKQLQALEAKT